MHDLKKFYLLLLLAIIIAGSIFSFQLIKARKITISPVTVPILSEGYYEIVTENDEQILGNPGAPLTVIMFTDFSCSTCKLQYKEVINFVKKHPLDVRLFLKEIPQKNLFTKTNDLPHRGAFCANKQNKYWEYIDALYNQKNISKESDLTKIASDLKLNTVSWWQCTNSSEAIQKIARITEQATTLGIQQIPTIYINNKKINLENDINITEILSKLIVK